MGKFKKNVGGPIVQVDAMKEINAFRAKFPDEPHATFIGADCVKNWRKRLKKTKGSAGLIAYNALGEDGKIKPIYYLVSENGNLISTSDSVMEKGDGQGTTGDNFTQQCPPICPCPPDDPDCNDPS